MKKRIALFLLMLTVFGGLIVWTRLRVPSIEPESPEEAALRLPPPEFGHYLQDRGFIERATDASQANPEATPKYDNAYYILVEAMELVPEAPALAPGEYTQIGEEDLLADALRLWAHDPSVVEAYLRQCRPAIAATREALSAKYFRYPPGRVAHGSLLSLQFGGPHNSSRDVPPPHLLAADGLYAALVESDAEEGLSRLCDAIQLEAMLLSDGCILPEELGQISHPLWKYIAEVAKRVESQDALAAAQRRAEEALADGYKASSAHRYLLHGGALSRPYWGHRMEPKPTRWWKSDFQEYFVGALYDPYHKGLGTLQRAKLQRYMATSTDDFVQALGLPWPVFEKWCAAILDEHDGQPYKAAMENLRYVRHPETVYTDRARRALLIILLERYRVAHRRYPSGTEELAPDLIAAVPHDPFTEQPYAYRVEADEYLIGGTGSEPPGPKAGRRFTVRGPSKGMMPRMRAPQPASTE